MSSGGRNRRHEVDRQRRAVQARARTTSWRPRGGSAGDLRGRIGVLAIAGEGRIHAGETELLPLTDGAAFFALRSRRAGRAGRRSTGRAGSAYGRRIRVRVGEPIPADGPPDAARPSTDLDARPWTALHELAADYPDPVPPARGSLWYA